MKNCPKCNETKHIDCFINNGHINKNCNECNRGSLRYLKKTKLEVKKLPEIKTKYKTPIGRVTDIIIPSVDRHNICFVLRTNNTEITVEHENGNVVNSNYNLTDKDKEDIFNFFNK